MNMKDYDEPLFVDVRCGETGSADNQIEAEIRELCFEQPFAVLATQGEGQPYTNLISFAFSENLDHLVFATPAQSRKYYFISRNEKVSLLIDNRAEQPESINLIRAITVTGKARVLENAEEIKQWSELLVKRHNYLKKFINSPTTSLILIEIIHFGYVKQFQKVYQWTPGRFA